uniref:Ig-like domain-containing protein n=1 Tax=Chelydra serpentina TaxID=8475 RepID=A0A8C3SUA0_CHESE
MRVSGECERLSCVILIDGRRTRLNTGYFTRCPIFSTGKYGHPPGGLRSEPSPAPSAPWRCPWGWALRAGYRHRGGVCVSPSHSCLCVNAELPTPRPSISVSPSGVIVLGAAVTLRCQCRCGARRLFLYKGGIENRELGADGDGGEFTIPSARQADGGVYTCRSHSRSELLSWSYPSDIVQIIVAGEEPGSLSVPSGGVALWGAVPVRCRGRHQNVRFLLYKDGNPTALRVTEPAGHQAEFPIRNVSRRDAGSYSCSYHRQWDQFILSHPSDPVELVVAGEGPGSVPRSQPHPHRTLRGMCKGAWGGIFCVVGSERKQRGTAASSSSPAPSGNGW